MAEKEIKLLQTDNNIFWANFNDIAIENNDIALVSGKDKLRQEIVKFLLVQKTTTPMFPNYGTSIPFLMNNRATAVVLEDIKDEIIYGVKYIRDVNEGEAINIQELLNIDMSVIGERELNVKIEILLTNGDILDIDESLIQ